MDDELDNTDSGIQPDAPGDLQRLEQLIASDEAADAAKAQDDTGRDSQGRFLKQGASASGGSASQAQRAGERLTPEVLKATPAKGRDANGNEVQPTKETPKPSAEADKAKAGDATQQQQQPDDKAGADPDAGKSKFQKENDRKEKTWEGLNKRKELADAREAEIELRAKTLEQREQALRRVPKRNGFTADDFEAKAPTFDRLAAHYEQTGDFAKADENRMFAEEARKTAAELRKQMPGGQRTTEQTWALLKADLPEALNTANPLNQELRTLIQQRPDLLADEAGPFRVAVLAGRKLVAGLETQLNASKAEAGKVPGLQAEVDRLSARVAELEGMTSPGGEGGGGAANRGSGRAKSPAEMSTAELEASIERDLASAY